MNRWLVIFSCIALVKGEIHAQKVLDDCPDKATIRGLDTCCGNWGDNLPVDTLFGPYPWLTVSTSKGSLSPDGHYLACNLLWDDWPDMFDGFVIVDLYQKRIVSYHPGARLPKWSPDGSRLLTTTYIFKIINSETIPFPLDPTHSGFYNPEWSMDGRYIYYTSSTGIYMSTLNGDSLKYLGSKFGGFPIAIDTMMYFYDFQTDLDPPGYDIYYIPTAGKTFIEVPNWRNIKVIFSKAVTADGRKIAMDVSYLGGHRLNDKHALCIFDRWTQRMKEVLPAQAFMNRYYPSWTQNGTLIISYVCRLDSSYTVWEVDTNGVFLRQLTSRDLVTTTTEAVQPRAVEREYAIRSTYPHPGDDAVTVEYVIGKEGRYALDLIDMSGETLCGIVSDTRLSPGQYRAALRTDDLPSGMYLVRLSPGTGPPVYHKLIVRR